MQCKKCGSVLQEDEKFCKFCGEKVLENGSQNNDILYQQNNGQPASNTFPGASGNNNFMNNGVSQNGMGPSPINQNQFSNAQQNGGQNNYQQWNSVPNNSNGKQKKILPIILAIIGGIVVLIIAIFVVVYFIVSANSNKLVCESSEGNITIMYNDSEITGYTAVNINYDLDSQKEYAKQVGIDAYILEFNTWFATNTTGTCTIDGKEVEADESIDTDNEDNDDISSMVTVGDENYGYIDVPSNWTRFYDTDGSTSLQYSYADVYIVTLDYLKKDQYSAEDYASSYMYNMQNSDEVTGVTGATVTIGKDKEYTAYQVYMYYPADSTYLVTYWFEGEDDNIHYIALEGPAAVTGYISIPESFRLEK